MKLYYFIVILSLLMGCSWIPRKAITVTKIEYVSIKAIERPGRPGPLVLDDDLNVEDESNIRKVMINISKDRGYIKDLEGTIDYYENEIERVEYLKDLKPKDKNQESSKR